MRLDKYLADISHFTRSDVKKLIRSGRITIDGETVKSAEHKVDYGTKVYVDDEPYIYRENEYYLLNKPAGYICATSDNHQPVVMDLIDSPRKDLAIVGRLDKDTEGLLLITSDGELNHRLTSPKYHVEKVYYVKVDKPLVDEIKDLLEKPMDLGDFISEGGRYEKIDNESCYLTISEGKYHQVKRMFEKCGYEVTYLERRKLAFLTLKGVERGKNRELSEREIEKLKKL